MMHTVSFCDVIFPNTHKVNYCPKITNLGNYPEVSIIGYVIDGGGFNYCYLINDTICLDKGPNQMSGFFICAVSNYYMEFINNDIDKIDWKKDKNAYLSYSIQPDPRYYVNDTDPLVSLDSYYKIMGFNDSALVMYLWKNVYGFNNGSADSVILYPFQGDSTSLLQHVRNNIILPSGLSYNLNEIDIATYPNPSKGTINIKIKGSYSGLIKFEFFNSNGELVQTFSRNKTTYTLIFDTTVMNLGKGTYFIKASNLTVAETKKIIID